MDRKDNCFYNCFVCLNFLIILYYIAIIIIAMVKFHKTEIDYSKTNIIVYLQIND